MQVNIEVVRRVCLARHLYQMACTSLASANELHLFSGVNLIQDAVEAFLLAVADCVGASLDERSTFDKYFVAINEKISPRELPFKNRLLRLNKIRVASKHHGIQPSRNDCQELSLAVHEFFQEVSQSVMHVDFASLSAVDLLLEGESKDCLLEAKKAIDAKDYAACAIACRQAIYIEFEQDYSIASFAEGKPTPWLLSKAPFFAQQKEYIADHVCDPTDYIVLDHQRLAQELLSHSVDTTAFWNVRRLTPEVYRAKDRSWTVKWEFAKLDPEVLKDTVEYVFSATTDILLAVHTTRQFVKTSPLQQYSVQPNREEVPIYRKADLTSEIICNTAKGVTELICDYMITGLKGDGPYWHVTNIEAPHFFGYVHRDSVVAPQGNSELTR